MAEEEDKAAILRWRCDDLIERARRLLADLSDDQRMEFLASMFAGYCRECGSNDLPCYCTRDD